MLARHQKIVIWILAGIVISYVNYRAAVLAFTYDESWSFNAYATADWYSTLWNLDPSANNHILHSLLMRFSWLIFGQQEYFLRLPILLAHLAYVWITFNICKRYLPEMAITAFVLLNFQPYLLDYFVAARGYGLALFFSIAGFYYLLKYNHSKKAWYLFLSSLLGFLAAWSNFTYLLIFISLLAVGFGIYLLSNPKKFIHIIYLLIPGLLGIWILWNPVLQLVKSNEFYYGGSNGFFSDTVLTLSKQMLYGNSQLEVYAWIYPSLVIIGLLSALALSLKRRFNLSLNFYISTALLIAPALGSVLLHFIMNKPYLSDRTALFLIPFSIIFLLFLAKEFKSIPSLKIWCTGLLSGLQIASVILFILSINFTYLIDFREHSDTRQALLDLQKQKDLDNISGFKMGQSKYMNATINFYWTKYNLKFMNRGDLTFCNDNGPYPYYYLFGVDKACVEGLELELIKHYPVSDTYLYKNTAY